MRLVLLVLAVCLALCPLAHAPRAAAQGTLDDIVVVVADTDGLTVDFEITVAMTEYYDEDPVAFLGDHFETTYYDATATLLVPQLSAIDFGDGNTIARLVLTEPGSVEGTFVGIVSHTYAAAGSYDVTVSAFSAEANPTPAHATALMASSVNPVTIHETNPYFHPSERTGSETSLPAAFALTVTLEGVAVCGADGAPCTSDGNVCTDDVCRENVCVHEPVTPGTACGSDASSECDAPDSCDESGICQSNRVDDETPCTSDAIECTRDVCLAGVCAHPLVTPGTPCGSDFDDECTAPDTCDEAGICRPNHSTPGFPCPDDANDCTLDVCANGVCTHPAVGVGTSCGSDETSECSQADSCDGAGRCLANDLTDGSDCTADANECTDDVCVRGLCQHPALPLGTDCGDPLDDACTGPDTCNGSGVCSANHTPDGTTCAQDENECTDDVCQDGRCRHPAKTAGTACGSATDDACTAPDQCNGSGVCLPNHVSDGTSCDGDANDCTDDTCQTGVCRHVARALGSPCGSDVNDACTAPDSCNDSGVCLANHVADDTACPDDGNVCTRDVCQTGQCRHPAVTAGAPCGSADETTCTAADTCDGAGQCARNDADDQTACAPDQNPCTDDVCLGGLCAHPPVSAGTACGSAASDACSAPDTCDATGTCQPNHADDDTPCLPDDNPCTADVCLGGTCQHPPLPSGTACGDPGSNTCTSADTCDGAGQCVRNDVADGTSCDVDQNDCTIDACAGGLCVHAPRPAGTACGSQENDGCTAPDTCDASGRCLANDVADGTACAADQNACTLDACRSGICTHVPVPAGTACGSAATGECDNRDVCDAAGQCTPNPKADGTACSADENPCTDDVCMNGLCAHPASAAGTACGSSATTECSGPDRCDGTGACERGDLPDGTACAPDANPCTDDVCQAGACRHPASARGTACGSTVDATCTAPDSCDGSGTCLVNHVADGASCDADANDCTDDSCQAGACRHVARAAGSPCGSEVHDGCTAPDTCDDSGRCLDNDVDDGAACVDDGTPCTADVCLGGTCQHPAAPEGTACGSPASGECDQPDGCDGLGQCLPNHLHDGSVCSADDNPCTADVCVSGACAHPAEPEGTPCGDLTQDACTAPDACDGAGVCLAHHSADDTACVDDGNPCTADLCDRGRCEHPAMPIGTPCGDSAETACSAADTCVAGQCLDNDLPDGAACSDGAFCNGLETCLAGGCEPARSPCAQGLSCFEDLTLCVDCGAADRDDDEIGDDCDEDRDGDGLFNDEEDRNGDGVLDPGETDPDRADSDGDCLLDGEERMALVPSDPRDPDDPEDGPDLDGDGIDDACDDDADGDGLADAIEDHDGDGIVDPGETDPLDADSDDDGLCDGPAPLPVTKAGETICEGGEDRDADGGRDGGETDPRLPDSDGDCLGDGVEVRERRSDPLDRDAPTAGGECPVVCGDGALDPSEACDDGNGEDGDGCDAACEIELGFACSGQPSVCAVIPHSISAAGGADCQGGAGSIAALALLVLAGLVRRRRAWLAVLVASVIPLGESRAGFGTSDPRPAATLLLPYFEIDGTSATTLFSVNNVAPYPVIAHVAIWTDWGVNTVSFDLRLVGFDVQTINLRDVLVNGLVPFTNSGCQSPTLVPSELALQHSGQVDGSGLCSAHDHGDGILRGYVTIDVTTGCAEGLTHADGDYFAFLLGHDNVLWGDVTYAELSPRRVGAQEALFAIESFADLVAEDNVTLGNADFAEGFNMQDVFNGPPGPFDPLPGPTFYGPFVAGSGVDRREPLPSSWGGRFLHVGDLSNVTDFLVWRGPGAPTSPRLCTGAPTWWPNAAQSVTVFDGDGDVESPASLFGAHATSRIRAGGADLMTTLDAGWVLADFGDGAQAAVMTLSRHTTGVYRAGHRGIFGSGARAIELPLNEAKDFGTQSAVPAATLLLPYFEVDLSDDSRGVNTIFWVHNPTGFGLVTNVTLWSNLGIPTYRFPVYLPSFGSERIDLQRLFRTGTPPQTTQTQDAYPGCGSALPPDPLPESSDFFQDLTDLVNAHSARPVAFAGNLCYSVDPDGAEPRPARGYVTVDVVNDCSASFPSDPGYFIAGGVGVASNFNGLWGEYLFASPKDNHGFVDAMVHIQAHADMPSGEMTFYGRLVAHTGADDREPLGTVFATRVIKDASELITWRDPGALLSPFSCALTAPFVYPLGDTEVVHFDEEANLSERYAGLALFPWAAQRRRFASATWPLPVAVPFAGWLYLNLHTVGPSSQRTQAHVVLRNSFFGLGVGNALTPLDSGRRPQLDALVFAE